MWLMLSIWSATPESRLHLGQIPFSRGLVCDLNSVCELMGRFSFPPHPPSWELAHWKPQVFSPLLLENSTWKYKPSSPFFFSVLFTHPRNESSAVGNWLTVWGLMQEADGTEKQDGFQLLPFQAWLTRDKPAENLHLTADCQFDEQRAVTMLQWHQPLLPLFSFLGLLPLKWEEGGQEHFFTRSSCFKHPQVTGLLGSALVEKTWVSSLQMTWETLMEILDESPLDCSGGKPIQAFLLCATAKTEFLGRRRWGSISWQLPNLFESGPSPRIRTREKTESLEAHRSAFLQLRWPLGAIHWA